jgi:hypothetical protein
MDDDHIEWMLRRIDQGEKIDPRLLIGKEALKSEEMTQINTAITDQGMDGSALRKLLLDMSKEVLDGRRTVDMSDPRMKRYIEQAQAMERVAIKREQVKRQLADEKHLEELRENGW